MSNYKFERLSDKNIKDLVFLYSKAFNEKTSVNFLLKKYNTEPFGLSFIGFIAYDSFTNEPASYYGVFPVKVSYKNKIFIAAQSGDTMTHPNHRGKGLFITLAKLTYELARENGIEFIFGFPNENSYGGFVKKLDWIHYSNINNYKIKTGAFPLEKIAKKIPIFNFFYERLFLKKIYASKKLNSFPNSISQQSPELGFVIHDYNFFNYKTYYKSVIIVVEGIKCWVKIDGRLWIGDIEYCDKEKFQKVLGELISLSKKISCSSVHFSFFENCDFDKWLKEKYSVISQNPVGCLSLGNNINPQVFAYQSGDFDTF
jgi:hypothetical protein